MIFRSSPVIIDLEKKKRGKKPSYQNQNIETLHIYESPDFVYYPDTMNQIPGLADMGEEVLDVEEGVPAPNTKDLYELTHL